MDNVSEEAFQYFLKAYEYLRRKNYESAYHALHSGLTLAPTHYWAHRRLGYVAGKLKLYQEWSDERQYLLQGYGRFENNDKGQVEFVLRPDISIPSPGFTSVFTLLTDLGLAQFSLGRNTKSPAALRQSLVYFNQILTYDPDYTYINTVRAWCHVELQENEIAEELIRKDMYSHPNLFGPYLTLSRLSYRRRRILQCVQSLFQAVLAFFRDIDLNTKANKSHFHFATEDEETQYFAKHLINPNLPSSNASKRLR